MRAWQRSLIALGLGLCLLTGAARAADAELARWIAGSQRSEANRVRDPARHPAATLAFFGLDPEQSVVEIWPSVGAWWFEILSPYLRQRGRYIAALHAGPHNPAAAAKEQEAIAAKIAAQPQLYDKTVIAHHIGLGESVPAGSVDRLLTFLNFHNWVSDGNAEQALAEFHAALKPGGVLGVVDHRGRNDLSQEAQLKSGYLREDFIIALIEKAGFRLVARAEVNANPKDFKDYPEGVWTLPPSLRRQELERDKYLAIGESDKFTLRFVKVGP